MQIYENQEKIMKFKENINPFATSTAVASVCDITAPLCKARSGANCIASGGGGGETRRLCRHGSRRGGGRRRRFPSAEGIPF